MSLPRWDLSSIYPSVMSKEFRADLSRIHALKDEVLSTMESLSVREILDIFNEAEALISNTSAYATALLSTDTGNPEYMKAVSASEDAYLAMDEAWKAFVRSARLRKDEFSSPDLACYKVILDEIITESEHLMGEGDEKLASEFLKVSALSWSKLQESITSSALEGEKTLTELRSLAYSGDREERKDAYYREKALLKRHSDALSYCLNGVKGTVLLLEGRRKWNSPLERSLFSSRISRKTLDALIEALEESIPIFRRYLNVKARFLGLQKLSYYDIFAPIGKNSLKYSFEEAEEMVYSTFSEFSPDMGEFALKAFRNGWIDAEPRQSKVGGAYDEIFKKSGESRILMNFDSSYDSVSTMAHELGHAYHDSMVMDLPALLSSYPMTLAETASTFSETLLFNRALKDADDKEARIALIEQFLSSVNQTCLDILSRFYFEMDAFEKRRDGELSASEFNELMLDAEERTYGDAVCEKHEYMWAVKSHYYSEEFSFYNYPYAFGELFALALYKRSLEDPSFPDSYRQMLRKSGMESAEDAALSIGCNVRDKDFWLSGINVFEHYLEELESCL